ncbi:MAG: T9SS type A sorting domain-containing protein [bacterium]|nr:T9SS type A sorting domain-containing protein [bacterium]
MSRVTLLVVLFLMLQCAYTNAQQSSEFAVLLSATVNAGVSPSITLHWDADPSGKQIQITRKSKSEPAWSGTAMATLDSTATQWTDTEVVAGQAYEYRVLRYMYRQIGTDSNGVAQFGAWMGSGYISSGMMVLPERPKRTLVLVDSTMLAPLQQQLNALKSDLESEGWVVSIVSAPRAETFSSEKVERVRKLIRDEATAGGRDLGAILLIGRLPVLYSGAIVPDGHPDHRGAWPADGIYGELDGTYTDLTLNVPNTNRAAQDNVPGDGKYDQSLFLTDVDVPVGRVDFFNMPAFTEAATNPISEIDLLKNYLNRNHKYRTTSPSIRMGGIIDDNFQGNDGRFAASAWRGFSVFGGDTAVKAGDFFGTLALPPVHLMAYGCGGGNDAGASGVGSTTDMVSKPVNAVFTFLFGSYFGDWDTRNNFLRSALASKPEALTCAWSGRPHWYIHNMGLGETVGYSTRISQNATVQNGYYPVLIVGANGQVSTYSPFDRWIHIGLMGDPTLRAIMKPVGAVQTVTASTEYPNKVKLSWIRPVGDVDGYLVFRRRGANKAYVQLTANPITATSYADSTRFEGSIEYVVQTVALRSTASGTYYAYGRNASTNVVTTSIAGETSDTPARASLVASPNPAESNISFAVNIDASRGVVAVMTLAVYDIHGRTMWSFEQNNVLPGAFNVGFDASALAVGHYIVRMTTDAQTTTTPLTIAR